MSEDVIERAVHHVLIQEDRGVGMAVVNSSKARSLDGWLRERLAPYHRLTDDYGAPPREAFTFAHLPDGDGQAAVLRRVADDEGAGRNFCHAVVGPVDVLTPIAVALTAWRGWREPFEATEPAGAEDETDFADRVLARRVDLVERLEHVPADRVRALLALVFRDPGGKFGLAGVDPALVPATLFAVQEICLIVGRTEPWTFTTFAGGTAPGSLPRFAFMGELPASMPPEAGDRMYVDLARTSTGISDDGLRVADWMYGRFREIWRTKRVVDARDRDWAAWRTEFGKRAGSAKGFSARLHQYVEHQRIVRTWFEPAHEAAEHQPAGDQVPWPPETDEAEVDDLPLVVTEAPPPEPKFQPEELAPVAVWQPPAAPAFTPGSEPMLESATSSVDRSVPNSWSPATPADPLWWRIAQAGTLAELEPVLFARPMPVLSAGDRMMLWNEWRKGKLAKLLREEKFGRRTDYLKEILILLLGEPGDRGLQDELERQLRKWSHFGERRLDSQEIWAARRARDARTRTVLGKVRAELENVPAIVWTLKGVLLLLVLLTGMITFLARVGVVR